jgi:hypothetical protein
LTTVLDFGVFWNAMDMQIIFLSVIPVKHV